MNKAFQNGLLWLATIIILLHSFFPHSHSAETRLSSSVIEVGCQHDSHTSLLEVAEHIFTHDIGIDHLEHFQHSEISHFKNINSFDVLLGFEFSKTILSVDLSEISTDYILKYQTKSFISSRSLRAPPTI